MPSRVIGNSFAANVPYILYYNFLGKPNLLRMKNDYIDETGFKAHRKEGSAVDEFESLLAQNKNAVERWVYAKMSNPADAEDILQDTYFSAYRSFSTLRSKTAFLPWILGIAKRKCADWYRSRARNKEILVDSFPERIEFGAEDSAFEETMEALPEKDRMMLRLFYRDMLSQKEISAQLKIPEGTVKSRMNAARTRFRNAYPYQPKGAYTMQKDKKLELPAFLPEYRIVWKDEPAFPVEFEELTGWFIVPKMGEKMIWGMYDLPSRKLDVAYNMEVIGPASVHGLDGVAIRASVLPHAPLKEDDLMKRAVDASNGGHEEWMFIAQNKDGYTRFLSAEHLEHGVRTLTTFLDGETFMNNWGFGEDNRGMPVHLEPQGKIRRTEAHIQTEAGTFMDIAGRCELTLNGIQQDTVCVMDMGMYMEGIVSEQFLNHDGQTVLWRRFNRDDWAVDRYGKKWSELLPENERLTVNGQTYVHWYDCICIR